MNAQEIINYIATAPKKTPVKIYVNLREPVDFASCGAKVFGEGLSLVVFGNWADLEPVVTANAAAIADIVIENDRRNSGVPLLDIRNIRARIEPGAVIREKVEIGEGAVIMMGTMIDMGAVLGGRAIVGNRCHIGAGTVLAGVVEPASATPVVIEDDVMIGANAVVIEGVRVGRGAVVGAGAIVIKDVPAGAVVVGNPARIIKMKDEKTEAKTALIDALRTLD
jgi:tetrahydrodipicolinate N-acetyltransferase